MSSPQPVKMAATLVLSAFAFFHSFSAQAQPSGGVARVVVWQIKPNMDRQFEEGYKRHLGWHRQNGDRWAWAGWMVISGERDGYFVDGTFFHSWSDLDAPVS